jgi:hypothetical protein
MEEGLKMRFGKLIGYLDGLCWGDFQTKVLRLANLADDADLYCVLGGLLFR